MPRRHEPWAVDGNKLAFDKVDEKWLQGVLSGGVSSQLFSRLRW